MCCVERLSHPQNIFTDTKRSVSEQMEKTDRTSCEPTYEKKASESLNEKEELTWTEIDVEEVAIDGICGVY